MVWQVRDNCASTISTTPPSTSEPCTSKTEVESRSSRGSSSVTDDLGHAPGSGLVTTDASETSDNDSMTKFDRQLSLGVEMTESMTASSLLQFNKDVESLMDHQATRAVSENSSEEPREDFTQHLP